MCMVYRASMRPPSALSGGTATRLSSAINGPGNSSQRVGTAIGFADNVILQAASKNAKKNYGQLRTPIHLYGY